MICCKVVRCSVFLQARQPVYVLVIMLAAELEQHIMCFDARAVLQVELLHVCTCVVRLLISQLLQLTRLHHPLQCPASMESVCACN
jgi:hypothetical protein